MYQIPVESDSDFKLPPKIQSEKSVDDKARLVAPANSVPSILALIICDPEAAVASTNNSTRYHTPVDSAALGLPMVPSSSTNTKVKSVFNLIDASWVDVKYFCTE